MFSRLHTLIIDPFPESEDNVPAFLSDDKEGTVNSSLKVDLRKLELNLPCYIFDKNCLEENVKDTN